MKIARAMCIGGWMHGRELEIKANDYTPMDRYDQRNYWDLSLQEMLEVDEPMNRYYLILRKNSDTEHKEYFYLWNNDRKIFDYYFNKRIKYELF